LATPASSESNYNQLFMFCKARPSLPFLKNFVAPKPYSQLLYAYRL